MIPRSVYDEPGPSGAESAIVARGWSAFAYRSTQPCLATRRSRRRDPRRVDASTTGSPVLPDRRAGTRPHAAQFGPRSSIVIGIRPGPRLRFAVDRRPARVSRANPPGAINNEGVYWATRNAARTCVLPLGWVLEPFGRTSSQTTSLALRAPPTVARVEQHIPPSCEEPKPTCFGSTHGNRDVAMRAVDGEADPEVGAPRFPITM